MLPHVGLGTPGHLLGRDILFVRGEHPLVSKGILESAGAVAVELILHRTQGLGARLHRLDGRGIYILDIQMNDDR